MALLVLVGCSGGGGGKQAAPTTSAATGPATTVRPVDTSFTGQDSAQFCALAKTYNERFTQVSPEATPAELRTDSREGQAAISQAVNAAPAEIKNDVQILSAAFGTFLAELEKVDFDGAKLSPSALSELQTPEFQRSTMRFQAYIRTVCGVTG